MAFSPLPMATTLLSRALDRWEDAWESGTQILSQRSAWNRNRQVPEFPQHAREFAALARIHLKRWDIPTTQWKEALRNLPGHITNDTVDSLSTFDQTGMDQVASLISAVEYLNLK